MLVDWLRVTVPAGELERVQKWFGGAWVAGGRGWRGWYDRSASVLGSGTVAWCSRPGAAARQGVLVDLPGEACAGLGKALVPFLAWVLEVGGRVARVDVAVDDRGGRVSFERLWAATEEGRVVTRARGWRWLIGGRVPSGGRSGGAGPGGAGSGGAGSGGAGSGGAGSGGAGRCGWTLYVGAASSEGMLRIYDKAAEQGRAGAGDPWVRVELRCRGELAARVGRALAEGECGAILAEIAGRVRFVQWPRGEDRQRWRWPVAGWWRAVVGVAAQARERAVEAGEAAGAVASRAATWVRRSVAPSLAALVEVYGVVWLEAVLRDGGRRRGGRAARIVAGAHVVTGGGVCVGGAGGGG